METKKSRNNDLIITVRDKAKIKPTLAELIAKCDLSAPLPDILVDLENASSVGQEIM